MGFIFNRKKKVSKDGTNVEVLRYNEEKNREWQPVSGRNGRAYFQGFSMYTGKTFCVS